MLCFTKKHADFFFRSGERKSYVNKKGVTTNYNMWTCLSEIRVQRQCCNPKGIKVVVGKGVSNMKAHIETCIPEWREHLRDTNIIQLDTMDRHISVDNKTNSIYRWID